MTDLHIHIFSQILQNFSQIQIHFIQKAIKLP